MVKQIDYNSVEWKDHFYLDKNSPSGLSRKNDFYTGENYLALKHRSGTPVGSKSYRNKTIPMAWVVTLNKVHYKASRIIWKMYYGNIDETMVIDHLDGDPFNNSIENLSMKTYRANAQNNAKRRNSMREIVGVSRTTRVGRNSKEYFYWKAGWRGMDGKDYTKNFSCLVLGEDIAKQSAIDHRNLQISLLNAAGASYTERHTGLTPGTPPTISPVQPT